MLYLIGLGLGDPSDITVKGLNIVRNCDRVFLEAYTSIMTSTTTEEMEEFFGKKMEIADREMVESNADEILENAKEKDVAFLVIGDPLGATTHTDLIIRARELEIPTKVISNASIMNAVGVTGLQLYSFGETVSIPFFTETCKPESFFDKICENKKRGLHTLCLLDIKVKEPDWELIMQKKKAYLPPRFMSASEAAKQVLEVIRLKEEREPGSALLSEDSLCVGVARIGSDSQKIVACKLMEMTSQDLGPPLHSLIIPGNMHILEEEFLKPYRP